jgi:hypothetical protein
LGVLLNNGKDIMNKSLLVLLATIPLFSFGIEPIIFKLTETQSYTVPDGKILLIETIAGRGGIFYLAFDISEAHYTANMPAQETPYTSAEHGILNFSRPLKIPEHTIVSRSSGSYDYTVFGLLVDQSDLYANIETQSEGMLCQNGNFSFDVLATSPRPGKIKLHGSTDLEKWHDIANTDIKKTDPSSHSVSIPVSGGEKYYVKTLLTSVVQ